MKKLITLAMILALAACAGSDDGDSAKKKDEADKKVAEKEYKTNDLICPQVAILKEAEEITDYGANGSNDGNYAAKARMKNVTGDCAYQDKGIDIQFTLDMVAKAGVRLRNPQYSTRYFIAIVDPRDNIISRKLVTDDFDLSKDKILEITDPLHVFIPLTKTEILAGPDYRVLVGFDLSGSKASGGAH